MSRYFSLLFAVVILPSIGIFKADAQNILAKGEQPQLTVGADGVIRVVFGEAGKIYFASSTNGGTSFSTPAVVAEVAGMHLGMTRGPQLATSKDKSLVTAMDKGGNIHSFLLDHNENKWEKIGNVNDVDGSAPEGLMSIAADDRNNFYAVWLDTRTDHKNNICFTSLRKKQWSANRFVYISPDTHVCECCKPSITVMEETVAIMFRNWLKGSRDLYLATSKDGGRTFPEVQKLGKGTWPLNGCPMDGGGLSIDSQNIIHTAWQRDGIVYYAQPAQAEQEIGSGRHVALNGNLISWQQGSEMFVANINGTPTRFGEGSALEAVRLKDNSIIAFWEKDDHIEFKRIGH